MQIKITKITILSTVAFIVCFGLVSAWTGPTANPPSSNTSEPLNVGANPQLKSGSLQSSVDMRAPIYYDYPSTSYYIDPDGDSALSRLYILNDLMVGSSSSDDGSDLYLADRLYDWDNTDYYVNPGSTSVFNTITLNQISAYGFYYLSDINLKKDIKKIPNALEKVIQLEGVSFNWKASDKASIGLIAQDIEKVFPEVVHTDEESGLKSVEYGNLIAPLVEAIKEQQEYIIFLENRIIQIETILDTK